MRRSTLSVLVLSCVCAGILLFAFLKGWIIVLYPTSSVHTHQHQQKKNPTKKQATLSFWQAHGWRTEDTPLLWTQSPAENLYLLINGWLTLLEQEHVMDKRVTLQTALQGSTPDIIYLSFDRNPLPTQGSTHDKLMWLEGLLTTIRTNEPAIQQVMILVHHQPLTDDHLDFSNPWPIEGFTKKHAASY